MVLFICLLVVVGCCLFRFAGWFCVWLGFGYLTGLICFVVCDGCAVFVCCICLSFGLRLYYGVLIACSVLCLVMCLLFVFVKLIC